MSRGRQKISFEGLLQKNVLGTFTIIRGFADLRDLVEVSVAMPFTELAGERDSGYQRQLHEPHVKDIKRFLEKGRYRFFPEVILSLRSTGAKDPVVSYTKRRSSPNDQAYRVTVNLKALKSENIHRIHRIDGNHRLEAAELWMNEQVRSATFKSFATAPFCFVILDSDRPEDDDIAEAMLFNLINSKALPITSEHSLSVLMQDDGSRTERFLEDPQVYMTRWIKDKVKDWPQGFYTGMGKNPLTRLHSAAGVLFHSGALSKDTADAMESDAGKLFGPLYELLIQLRNQHAGFVNSSVFLPIAAEVYARHSKVEVAKGANTEPERISRSARLLGEFASWFERIGGADLAVITDPIILWTVFKRDLDRRAGQVFIAMSFRQSAILDGVHKAIKEAIADFNSNHSNTPLAPLRVDDYHGESFEIPSRVFDEIAKSQLVIADLTDEKQNVYCEIGYAKAKGIPFILTFHKDSKQANRIHFDLAPYRYIEYATTHELRDKLKIDLEAWYDRN